MVDQGDTLIRSARFRKEREADWQKLEGLVKRAERSGLSRMSFEDVSALSTLYRQCAHSLALARSISLDQALLVYLENLTTRAWFVVYGNRDGVGHALLRFFTHSAPATMRACWPHFLLALVFFAAGALVAYLLVQHSSEWYYSFVYESMSSGRGPQASAEALRQSLYPANPDEIARYSVFANHLFTHNTQVAFFALALGIMVGAPTALLLFYNGTVLGAFFAVHHSKGLAWDLFGWLSIHGVTELSAIFIAGAAGLRMGQAMLFPGLESRARTLRDAGRQVAHLALIAMIMLFAAGMLEGFARQMVQDTTTRLTVGWGIGVLWLLWFLKGKVWGKRRGRS